MSTQKRKKDSILNLRISADDAEFIEAFAAGLGLKKVQVIELGLDMIRNLNKTEAKEEVTHSIMNRLRCNR